MSNEFKKGDLVECDKGDRYFLREEIKTGKGGWWADGSSRKKTPIFFVTYLPTGTFHHAYTDKHSTNELTFKELMLSLGKEQK